MTVQNKLRFFHIWVFPENICKFFKTLVLIIMCWCEFAASLCIVMTFLRHFRLRLDEMWSR
jgi:hypothetical protein